VGEISGVSAEVVGRMRNQIDQRFQQKINQASIVLVSVSWPTTSTKVVSEIPGFRRNRRIATMVQPEKSANHVDDENVRVSAIDTDVIAQYSTSPTCPAQATKSIMLKKKRWPIRWTVPRRRGAGTNWEHLRLHSAMGIDRRGETGSGHRH
jgi:hypothetical protein